jgi:hypothetical protein
MRRSTIQSLPPYLVHPGSSLALKHQARVELAGIEREREREREQREQRERDRKRTLL